MFDLEYCSIRLFVFLVSLGSFFGLFFLHGLFHSYISLPIYAVLLVLIPLISFPCHFLRYAGGFQQMFVKNGICTSDFDKSNNSVTLLSSQRKTCETMAPFPRTPTRVTRARRPRPRFIMQSVPVS